MKVSSIKTGTRDYLHKDTFNHHVETDMKYTPTYGYFEIRAKTINQEGYHCAFWTTGIRDDPTQEAEIDILEQYQKNGETGFNLHPWDDPDISDTSNRLNLPFDPSDAFHIYALEWDVGSIKFYVDNVLTSTINQSQDYGAVFYLSVYENAGWTGMADTSGGYPREFIIDNFRAYKKIPPAGSEIVEAEDMDLFNYNIITDSSASNSHFIQTSGTGTARYIFDGPSGEYNVRTSYFDENDGDSSYNLYVNDILMDSWIADRDLGSAGVIPQNLTSRYTESVFINTGDEIKIEGTFDDWEYARLDKVVMSVSQ